ncbi:uncharacterized protein LOC125493632 [Beta vulgaris subsp. vulgaris]|uniref:uncharacterized protein LOC125493632 n=1 Tax=Beta vulgaris subsp. vulgaris TaxID=3555 RepID=UPI00254858AE|nr:uncharacterized protein LOC125493632 [Beta vulgaris subsp. vulgaris]
MSSNTARDMRWHFDRKDDKIITHPADGEAWKKFDDRYEEFAKDPRSVRLGLASDGFNPYRLMNTNYSTWPVILIPYNLPPWLCVDAFDVYSGKNFKLRASLHSTINDFPAYAMLSGWSTKGYKACPTCANSTCSYYFGGKIVYPGSRKWLPIDHPYRSQANLFDGKEEYGLAPVHASGTEILKQQEVNYVYGKSKTVPKKRGREEVEDDEIDNDNDKVLWKKKSILFDLEYWEHNLLRHNLDVMHIEKNVCDNLLGTLLETDKSRDDKKAREALKQINIKSHLWLQTHPNRVKEYMPPASYNMDKEEKERFLRVLKKLRVPDGYGSNLQRCVNMKERKLINMKSHDNHILMQEILPVALRASNATKVIDLLEELSYFFKKICSTTIDKGELDTIQSKLVLTLCKMEKDSSQHFSQLCDFLQVKRQEHRVGEIAANEYNENQWRLNEFSDWLQNQIHNLDDNTVEGKLRKALAGGLSNRGKRMKSVIINGYKFDTVDRERFRKTQNSGVMVEADGQEYYGKLKEIFELDYYGSFRVVMFRCDWVDIRRGFKTYPSGRVTVNFSKLMHTGRNLHDDPFVFSSQAKQVFYVEDEIQKGWLHVIKTKPRDLFDIPEDDEILE